VFYCHPLVVLMSGASVSLSVCLSVCYMLRLVKKNLHLESLLLVNRYAFSIVSVRSDSFVSSVASRQHLRSANRGLLVVPRYRLSSYGRRAFSVAGPATWNWLPDSMRDPAISRDSFRRSLKTFFYFQLTCVHSALELSGRCALQIYLLTYLLTYLLNFVKVIGSRLGWCHPGAATDDLFSHHL